MWGIKTNPNTIAGIMTPNKSAKDTEDLNKSIRWWCWVSVRELIAEYPSSVRQEQLCLKSCAAQHKQNSCSGVQELMLQPTHTHTEKCLEHNASRTSSIFGIKQKERKIWIRQPLDTPKLSCSSPLLHPNICLSDGIKSPHTPTDLIKSQTPLIPRAGKCSGSPDARVGQSRLWSQVCRSDGVCQSWVCCQ